MSVATVGRYHVVVGFDGSKGAERALQWAAADAQAHQGVLDVVQAWRPESFEFGGREEWQERLQDALSTDVQATLGPRSEVEVTTSVVEGSAAGVLLERSLDADMLVVGSRGRGGFAGLLTGSVGNQVVNHGTVPVVVVVRP